MQMLSIIIKRQKRSRQYKLANTSKICNNTNTHVVTINLHKTRTVQLFIRCGEKCDTAWNNVENKVLQVHNTQYDNATEMQNGTDRTSL